MGFSGSDINAKPLLSGFAQDYASQVTGLIARKLFPVLPVDKQDAKYPLYGKENLYVPNDDLNSNNGTPREATRHSELVDIHCVPHGLLETVDRQQNSEREEPMRVKEMQVVQGVVNKLLINEEVRVKSIVENSANGTALSGDGTASTNKWSGAGGDPFAVKKTALENLWFEPNTLVLGYNVYTALKNNPKILAKLSSAATQVVTKDLLKEIFEVENILIGTARSAGDKPQKGSPSISSVWAGLCAFAYVTEDFEMPTAGRIFVEKQTDVDTEGFWVGSWFDPKPGVKGKDNYKVSLISIEKLIASDCLYTIKGCA